MADLELVLADIARSIVADPDRVEVKQTSDGDDIAMELNVAPDDMGKVIGRHGRIAHAIRLVMKAAAAEDGKKVTVEIK